MVEKIKIIDLFAGCGGLSDGFEQTQLFETQACVEWDIEACRTLENRLTKKWNYKNATETVFHFDIQRTEELINGWSNDPAYGSSQGLKKIFEKGIDVVIGGPPCQAYSIAGRVRDKNGMQDDYRNYLFESYVKIVNYCKPKAFVFENVEGILSAKPGGIQIVDRIKTAFKKIGYEITDNLKANAVFDTSYYNVPQKRKRVIIFGVQKSQSSKKAIEIFYSQLKGKASKSPMRSKIAFENLPKIYPCFTSTLFSHSVKLNGLPLPKNHEPRIHSPRDIQIFKLLANDIKTGEEKYTSTQALIKLYKDKTGKDSKFHKYHVIREDKPSNTIPAHLYKDGLRHIHPDPEQARSITVREAARLQSFDDDFEFMGSRGGQYKMIGNAVPPKFAKIIAETISDIFKMSLKGL